MTSEFSRRMMAHPVGMAHRTSAVHCIADCGCAGGQPANTCQFEPSCPRCSPSAVSLSADSRHGAHCYDADGILICGWPDMHIARRCGAVYGGTRFDNGLPVKCEASIGHVGEHFNSFAMRAW